MEGYLMGKRCAVIGREEDPPGGAQRSCQEKAGLEGKKLDL